MIRLLVGGRLGNQLFQYAAVRAQAKRLGVELEIDLVFCNSSAGDKSFSFWLETLPIRARIIRYPAGGPCAAHSLLPRAYRKMVQPAFWQRYQQPSWQDDRRFFDIKPRTIVSGYFQSLFYMMPRDEEILSELSLWNVASAEAAQLAKSIARQNYVSVHVRRGDYLVDHHEQLADWQSGHPAYFGAAMGMMRRKVNRPTFLIFSDDTEWCKQSGLFQGDCEFVEPNRFGDNPAIDLLLMSSCHHHIITNSTYSWWAAWASLDKDKLCILPEKWTPTQTTAELGLVYRDWITL